jgi:hypothetical protein
LATALVEEAEEARAIAARRKDLRRFVGGVATFPRSGRPAAPANGTTRALLLEQNGTEVAARLGATVKNPLVKAIAIRVAGRRTL